MARKRYSDEDILKLLREIELRLAEGSDVQSACRGVGVSDATYYNWRRRFGGMGKSQLSELRTLEKENARLKKVVAELERSCHTNLVTDSWQRSSVVGCRSPRMPDTDFHR
jgi:putative transposase